MSFSTQDSDEVLSEMNVTPLVDVMLVLLVVFIVTAPLMTNAIKVNLPKTDAVAAAADKKDPVVVSVDQDGKFYLAKSEVAPESLELSLKDVKAKDPEVRVQLQADTNVNYGQVAKAMASIERSGITKISVMTSK
ncbi:biopolymer transporter ExbD [Pseudomonas sp. KU26590]|uniref:ExbD/TolR family protein n=1 Tax=Pseudomonas sp. KU26590 TaxID=2991051 RepID=UPI00223D89AD|nr:biopolymer transporter ExbD [Pseudomonas sp. KU26590]UZJ58503.1 biopolymer transporter ExbD [Pseudomonas sp. KU26590]